MNWKLIVPFTIGLQCVHIPNPIDQFTPSTDHKMNFLAMKKDDILKQGNFFDNEVATTDSLTRIKHALRRRCRHWECFGLNTKLPCPECKREFSEHPSSSSSSGAIALKSSQDWFSIS